MLADLPRPAVALLPDAGMAIKRWPADRWMALGRALAERGASILVPAGDDGAEARRIAGAAGGRMLPRTGLRDLAAVLAQADLAIGADTGPLRIAAAVGTRTVGLFGPSWSGRYGHAAPHINLQGHPACPLRIPADFTRQACWYGGACPLPGRRTCVEDVSLDEVLRAAEPLLDARSPSTATTCGMRTDADWARAERLLVVRMDNAGDVVMAGPALRALRDAFPSAGITLLASPAGAHAAAVLPWIDDVIPWRALWQEVGDRAFDPADDWRLIETLRARRFHGAVVLTSFSQSPHPPALACLLAGIPLRLGESAERADGALTHQPPSAPLALHQAERNLRLVEWIGVPVRDRSLAVRVPDDERAAAAAVLAARGIAPGDPYLLLTPFTSAPAREYPAARWAAAARIASAETALPVVVAGVERDRGRATPLLDALGGIAVDAVGATSFAGLAALVQGARLVLTGNTATMHLADALRVPQVVPFAGTELQAQWHPRHGPARLLRRPTDCHPCYAFTCPVGHACLDIPADEVAAAALALLRPAPAPADAFA